MATTGRVTRLEQAVQRLRTWQQSHDKWHEEVAKEMEEERESLCYPLCVRMD